jgi:GNAT superfamily N-acetyltransferase
MCDEWMRGLKLPLTPEQFVQLPCHPAFRYDYLDGHACITPRPRHYHALLELGGRDEPAVQGLGLRRIRAEDWNELVPVFAAAFQRTQPFAGLDDATRQTAAQQCLTRTRLGGDGPWIERASFVTCASSGKPVGAILVTLLPGGDPCLVESYAWSEPPPAMCIERRLGRPHMTWVFVEPTHARAGVGTTLLAAAVQELRALGYTQLASTFLIGNDPSILWHWRNGFRLLSYPGATPG